ncbi:MAG: hypothetical protein AUF65_01765 [Chloroflexi bacterium 13_1_20CM_50_12]|nr:MAG: hypothetical protein AUF65_01765 [Chloroflexi bacterium 13_1_20CM_50_12]
MHIARDDGSLRADDHAGRFQAKLRAVRAVVALGSRMRVGVDIERIIGAGLHAGFAADTATGIEIDDAVLAFVERARRANSDAWRVIAVIAAVHQEIAAGIGELAPLDVLDPRSIHPDGDMMTKPYFIG